MIDRSKIPPIRCRTVNEQSPASGDYVLYWMIANRRLHWNFSLDRAVEWSLELNKPLIILEALRSDYRWNCDRFHWFVVQGMLDNAARAATSPACYYPYLEEKRGAGKGLLRALAKRAAVVVSDDFPCFFLPRMLEAAAKQIPTRFELVDSNGLLPMRAAPKVFSRAYDFRRFLQKNLLEHLDTRPKSDALSSKRLLSLEELPASITSKWAPTDLGKFREGPRILDSFPIDHTVGPVATPGGSKAANRVVRDFLRQRLDRYCSERNQPEKQATSGLSPYLHFGHISAHQVFNQAIRHEEWSVNDVADKATGSSSGWWGVSESLESFLDEFITWRELGYNMCWQVPDYDQYQSLPEWARRSLAKHARDPREHIYEYDQFENGKTHDELWNAAQRQLLCEGRIHNYLRMLWGKKILQWSPTPEDALDTMIELNNKFALDGRNPNSYSGIFWVLGRYDRAWGPERPIFGKIRYMTSENTARKVKVKGYIAKYSGESRLF